MNTNITTMTNQQSMNAVDSIWDGWLNSFRTLQGLQNEMAEKSLQAVENQKEFMNTTRGALKKMEEEESKIKEEWKTSLQSTMNTVDNNQGNPLVSTWMNQIEEINNSVQALSWTPSKIMLDLFTQSQNQFESNIKEALDQQQKGRSEVLKTVEQLTEKMKQTHKELLPTV
jgi:seryl-tRNA synthetase